jgi:hypothetical protein
MSDREVIRTIVRTLYDFQDLRIRLAGRLRKKANEEDMEMPPDADEIDLEDSALPIVKRTWGEMVKWEAELKKVLAAELKGIPIYESFLKDVKGIGPQLAGVIISEYDITKAPTVSNLWSFTGLAPGKDKLVKGQKATFNKWLRTKMCGVLAGSFLKCGSPYRQFYDNMKARLEQEEGWKDEPKPGHRHHAALRYMIKMFLKDLYVSWRTVEGLSVRPPYEEEYLGRKHSA